ncbi:hypothetical protein ACFQ51_50350 [Streptomyces kaempferi]
MNRQLHDINPYPAFVQAGLQSSGLGPSRPHSPADTHTRTADAFESSGPLNSLNSPGSSGSSGISGLSGPGTAGGAREGSADPHEDVPGDGTGNGIGNGEEGAAAPYPPLHRLGARLSGLLDSGLLGPDYPLRPRLRALADTVLRDAVRTVARSAPDAARHWPRSPPRPSPSTSRWPTASPSTTTTPSSPSPPTSASAAPPGRPSRSTPRAPAAGRCAPTAVTAGYRRSPTPSRRCARAAATSPTPTPAPSNCA